ncbi:unnamed protein product [Paramecium sonneborni]|uniref:Uncharacterized protein n=1 Tax=Paramecium sonneborni TaxID=65129 RepID=A0A8S1PI74_9CILI|nr:unnamed protein product [Paramecium sonneborni]
MEKSIMKKKLNRIVFQSLAAKNSGIYIREDRIMNNNRTLMFGRKISQVFHYMFRFKITSCHEGFAFITTNGTKGLGYESINRQQEAQGKGIISWEMITGFDNLRQ